MRPDPRESPSVSSLFARPTLSSFSKCGFTLNLTPPFPPPFQPRKTARPPKRRKERLRPFEFNAEELEELAVALRAFVNAKRDTSQPVTSWSNLVARKWPREYALSKQATGVKCTAQKVMEAIDKNLLHRYEANWGWRGGWPAAAEMYPPCTISLQHGNV